MLDYGVAAAFFTYGTMMRSRHQLASTLAFVNGAGHVADDGLSGGVVRALSFRGIEPATSSKSRWRGLGPILLGFGGDREADCFYGQALSEVGLIAAAEWKPRR